MASTILELAASMVRIFEQMRLRCLLIAAAAALVCDFPCERDIARDPVQDVYSADFSPDGTQVAVAREDGAIVVWPARASAHAGAR